MTGLGHDASDFSAIARRVDAFLRGEATYADLVGHLAAILSNSAGGDALHAYLDRMAALGGLPAPLAAALRDLADRPPAPPVEVDDHPTRRTGPRRVYGGTAASASPSGDPLRQLIGRTLAGRYEVDAVIGRRTHGTAFRAIDRAWHGRGAGRRHVALTVLDEPHARDSECLGRIRLTADRVRGLGHPSLDWIHEVLRDGELTFTISEHRVGRTLSSLLGGGRDGGWPLRVVMPIGHRIAEALAPAHRTGMVHAALGTDTVLLTADDEIVVLDLGIRSAVSPSDISADPREDVRGLAAIVLALLSGDPSAAVGRAERPAALRDASWQALMQGLAADPLARPANPEAFMVSLEDPGWLGRLVGHRPR